MRGCTRINGNTLGNHYSLTKLLWLKEHQPDLYQQTHKFLHWSGFVSFMLGADPVVDYSLANRTLLFDLERRDWSDRAAGAGPGLIETNCPDACPRASVIGQLAPADRAASWVCQPASRSSAAATTSAATASAAASIEPGSAMYGMGTYLCMMPVYTPAP